jgi:hypothetical protein
MINNDANTASVNFKIDDAADDVKTSSAGFYFLDGATAHKAFIGAARTTNQSTWGENYFGFMYNFFLDATYLTGTSTHWFA